MALNDFTIGCGILFDDDLNGGKASGEAGTGQFVTLLSLVAFGHENKPVASG